VLLALFEVVSLFDVEVTVTEVDDPLDESVKSLLIYLFPDVHTDSTGSPLTALTLPEKGIP
jgi:hypothetical protein